MCILFVCSLLNVVSHFDPSVLSTPVMGLDRRGVGVAMSSIQLFGFFLTLQSPLLIFISFLYPQPQL